MGTRTKVLFILLSLIFTHSCTAQLPSHFGPQIISPAEGFSVGIGSLVTVEYTFSLLGSGTYATAVNVTNTNTNTSSVPINIELYNSQIVISNTTAKSQTLYDSSFQWKNELDVPPGTYYLVTSQIINTPMSRIQRTGIPFKIIISCGAAVKAKFGVLATIVILSSLVGTMGM